MLPASAGSSNGLATHWLPAVAEQSLKPAGAFCPAVAVPMATAAWRSAASADWKASCRSYWLAAALFCMMVPPIDARPTSVMTINRINATTNAAPCCARWAMGRSWMRMFMSVQPVANGGGERIRAGERAAAIGADVVLATAQLQGYAHGSHTAPGAACADGRRSLVCAVDGGVARRQIGDRHVGHVAHHFLRLYMQARRVVNQSGPIQGIAVDRIGADVPIDRAHSGDQGIRRKRVLGTVAGASSVRISEIAGTVAGGYGIPCVVVHGLLQMGGAGDLDNGGMVRRTDHDNIAFFQRIGIRIQLKIGAGNILLDRQWRASGTDQLQRTGIGDRGFVGECRIARGIVVTAYGIAPVGPPGRSNCAGGIGRRVGEHIDNAAVGAVASSQASLADVARHHLESDAGSILDVAKRRVGAVGTLVGQKHTGHAGNDDQPQQHGDHQLDDGETILATGPRSRAKLVWIRSVHNAALVTIVTLFVLLSSWTARPSSNWMVTVQIPVLAQAISPVVLADAPRVLDNCSHQLCN